MDNINTQKVTKNPLDVLKKLITDHVGKATQLYFEKNEKLLIAGSPNVDDTSKQISEYQESKSIDLQHGTPLTQRTIDRVNFQQTKKQINIEKIINIASEQLKDTESSENEKEIDEDWSSQFFSHAENISNEEMQALWGRILSGEISKPGSYNIRTLDILKTITKAEAEIFIKAGSLAIQGHGNPFIFKVGDDIEESLLSFNDRLLLIEMGLLQADTSITRTLKSPDVDTFIYFDYGKFLIRYMKDAKTPETHIQIFRFSYSGEELLKLISPNINEDYMKKFVKSLSPDGSKVDYCYILNKDMQNYTHTAPWEKFELG